MDKIIKLVALYARVSTGRQEQEETIKNQLLVLREYAEKNGYTIVQEYTDDGWSGAILARPSLDQLRQDARKKIWDAVLIYDPDRLSRKYSHQELVRDEFREIGTEIIYITTPTPKNEEDRVLYGVKGIFAEYEREKIKERFRLGKLRKAREGFVLMSTGPYGHTYIAKTKEKNGHLEINTDEATVLRRICTWIVNEKLTLRRVVKRLEELGIPPRKSSRGVWNTSTLANLLRNTSLIGEAHFLKSYGTIPEKPLKEERYKKNKKTSRKIRPEEEWIKIPCPPIIDKETFDRVQVQLRLNFEKAERNRKNEYLLSGKIRCICGSTRTGEGPQKGKHLYYRCSNRVKSFPLPPTCTEKGTNAQIADKLVWNKIVELMSSPELLSKQLNRWLNEREQKPKMELDDVEIIKRELEKLKQELDRYNKAYGAGLFSMEQLREYTKNAHEKISSLESKMAIHKEEIIQTQSFVRPQMLEMEQFAHAAVKTLKNLNFKQRKTIVDSVIDKIIGTKTELEVFGYLPIQNYGLQTLYRNRRIAKCRKIIPVQSTHQKRCAYRKLPVCNHRSKYGNCTCSR